jgi:hypothetical protein
MKFKGTNTHTHTQTIRTVLNSKSNNFINKYNDTQSLLHFCMRTIFFNLFTLYLFTKHLVDNTETYSV